MRTLGGRRSIVLLALAALCAAPASAQSTGTDQTTYDSEATAILLVDPFNDFLSDGGKLWGLTQGTAEDVDLLPNLRRLVAGAREAGIQIVYVPHHHATEGDLDGWEYPNPTQRGTQRGLIFEEGSWGAEYHPDLQMQQGDLEAQQHWVSSGFANTDLDLLLRARGIDHVVLAGVRANTCVEATGRYAVELGYHATLLEDAIAAFSPEEMQATIEVNFPAFGHAVLSTGEFLRSIR